MKIIEGTQGFVFIVDDDMFEELNQHEWSSTTGTNGGPFAVREVKRERIYMHRLIAGACPGDFVDHIDGNVFDNRRENLRVCSNKENIRNMKPRKGFKTKGVHYCKSRAHLSTPWQAYITVDGKRLHLGYHISESYAQHAYNAAALQHFGAFARIV